MPSRKSARTKTPKKQAKKISDDQLERYRLAFAKLDTDGSGAIDVDELHAAMRKHGLKLSLTEVNTMISEGDDNDDMELDYDEFVALMEKARSFRSSKAWTNAYDKFVGKKSQTLKSGFLREMGVMMTDPDDDSMRVGKLTCCDRFLVNLAGQYVDYGFIVATGGIYLLAMLWAWFMKRYVVLFWIYFTFEIFITIQNTINLTYVFYVFYKHVFLNYCFGYHQIIYYIIIILHILNFLMVLFFYLLFFFYEKFTERTRCIYGIQICSSWYNKECVKWYYARNYYIKHTIWYYKYAMLHMFW